MDKLISGFIEDVIWGEDVPMDLRYLIDYSQVSSKGVDYYLNKIFNEGKINPQVLKLFFKFFPNELTRFYENLERKRSDMIFMGKVIESLKLVEYSISMNIYKHIFSVANELMKIEVLRAMQDLPDYDAEFLFSIIRGKDALLKKEALVVLMRNDMHKKKAIEILLSIRSPLGIKNRIIFENIRIIEEVGLKEAKDYLIPISKNPFFWNRDIKREAQEILGKWDARKD